MSNKETEKKSIQLSEVINERNFSSADITEMLDRATSKTGCERIGAIITIAKTYAEININHGDEIGEAIKDIYENECRAMAIALILAVADAASENCWFDMGAKGVVKRLLKR